MTLVQWALFGAWEIWGLVVWLGLFRGWRSRGPEAAFLCLLMPWLAWALVLLVVVPEATSALVTASWSNVVSWIVAAGATACLGIGFSVGIAERPSWALPPWYRASRNSRSYTRVARVPHPSPWLETSPIQSCERGKEQ
jgi:hypothetical protein